MSGVRGRGLGSRALGWRSSLPESVVVASISFKDGSSPPFGTLSGAAKESWLDVRLVGLPNFCIGAPRPARCVEVGAKLQEPIWRESLVRDENARDVIPNHKWASITLSLPG